MTQKCSTCKENITYERYRVITMCQKCYLEIWVENSECLECAVKRVSKKFAEAFEIDIVSIRGREMVVDWKFFLDVYFNIKKYPLKHFENLIELLLALNIFSFDAKDNYEIVNVVNRFSMNPRQHGFRYLFFTRLSDVKKFQQLKAGEGLKDWSIQHIKDIY
ncbi:MAG: hypothetical protein U9P90_04225 [Patescibacteria group bacterium]|nr:hypothetical protein [Patescibacteria group bacterium]